jgi:hypothetical protein
MSTFLRIMLVSFIYLLICQVSFSQTNSGSDGVLFAKQLMGKHLSSINDSLFCAEGSNALYSPSSETSCKSFIVKKINGEKSQIANIIFSYTFVFTNFYDSSKIIDHVSFMNTYSKNVIGNYQEIFSIEYKIILKYLVKLFGKKGKTGEVYKDKNYHHHNLVWQDEKFKYILTRDIQKNFLGISYSVQAKK